jgi:hypothetical protein
VFPGIANRGNLSFDPARAKPTRHQDAIDLAENTLSPLPFNFLRFDPLNIHPCFMIDAAMDQRL